jgi:hypothetical protein
MKALLVRSIAAGLALTLSACATTETPPEEPTLIVRENRLFIPARIAGVETEALLDSGAELTIVDAAYAEEIGLTKAGSAVAKGTGGETEASFVEGVTVEAAGIVLGNRTIAAIDLADLSQRLIGTPVKLIVGREFFDSARLEIDIEKGSIAAVARGREPRGVRLATETHRGLETIPVSIEGGEPVQADFDLGNGSEMLIGAAYAARAGLSAPGRIVGQQAGGGLGGEIVRDLVTLTAVEVAGVRFENVGAAIDTTPTAMDANVGVRLLRNFRMTVDFAENAIWLEPRPTILVHLEKDQEGAACKCLRERRDLFVCGISDEPSPPYDAPHRNETSRVLVDGALEGLGCSEQIVED